MMAVTKPPREKERINVMAADTPTAVDVSMEAPHEAVTVREINEYTINEQIRRYYFSAEEAPFKASVTIVHPPAHS